MRYSETFKKSQTKTVANGFEIAVECNKVLNVENENSELIKFQYDKKNGTLTVLEGFKLVTVTYEGK